MYDQNSVDNTNILVIAEQCFHSNKAISVSHSTLPFPASKQTKGKQKSGRVTDRTADPN